MERAFYARQFRDQISSWMPEDMERPTIDSRLRSSTDTCRRW